MSSLPDGAAVFRDLPVGATFDFVDDERHHLNSFYSRVIKTGKRSYEPLDNAGVDRMYLQVGSINVVVYHVEPPR